MAEQRTILSRNSGSSDNVGNSSNSNSSGDKSGSSSSSNSSGVNSGGGHQRDSLRDDKKWQSRSAINRRERENVNAIKTDVSAANVEEESSPISFESSEGRDHKRGSSESKSKEEIFSRKLSSILRHNFARFGLSMSTDGFIELDAILALRDFSGVTISMIEEIVKNNSKQRFSLKVSNNGTYLIRANQGHSVEVPELELVPITNAKLQLPHPVLHGTYYSAWDFICKEGLSRMGRRHIHFAAGKPGDGGIISGMRSSAQIHIYLNVEKCLEDGIILLKSTNNVILSPGGAGGMIEPKYFLRVEDAKTGKSLKNTVD